MQNALRYGAGWVVAAVAAASLSWAVISDAVDPARFGRGSGAGSSYRPPAGPQVIGSPVSTVGASGDRPDPTAGTGRGVASITVSSRPGATPDGSPAGSQTVTHGTHPSASSSLRPGASRTSPAVVGGSTSSSGAGSGSGGAPSASSTRPGPRTTSVAPAPATTATGGASSGAVRSYQVKGGQVVLRLGESSATLVSATPEAGYRVQTWEAEGWLRVDFSAGNAVSSVFATWNGHAPSVETVEY